MIHYCFNIFLMIFVFHVGSCQEPPVTLTNNTQPTQDLQDNMDTTSNHTVAYKVLSSRLAGLISAVRSMIEKYLPLGRNFITTARNHIAPIEAFLRARIPAQILNVIERIVANLDAAYSYLVGSVTKTYSYIPKGLKSADYYIANRNW